MSARCVVIIDTSILCVWLKVPGLETCGPDDNRWDFSRASREIDAAIESGHTLVLPLATLIESGNHIAHAPDYRFEAARRLADLITKSADQETPWAPFTDQSELWAPDSLKRLASCWPTMAARKLGIGDATIRDVAQYYGKMGWRIKLLTGDAELAAYQPSSRPPSPRRRSRRP